jgi:hypothetical protein
VDLDLVKSPALVLIFSGGGGVFVQPKLGGGSRARGAREKIHQPSKDIIPYSPNRKCYSLFDSVELFSIMFSPAWNFRVKFLLANSLKATVD